MNIGHVDLGKKIGATSSALTEQTGRSPWEGSRYVGKNLEFFVRMLDHLKGDVDDRIVKAYLQGIAGYGMVSAADLSYAKIHKQSQIKATRDQLRYRIARDLCQMLSYMDMGRWELNAIELTHVSGFTERTCNKIIELIRHKDWGMAVNQILVMLADERDRVAHGDANRHASVHEATDYRGERRGTHMNGPSCDITRVIRLLGESIQCESTYEYAMAILTTAYVSPATGDGLVLTSAPNRGPQFPGMDIQACIFANNRLEIASNYRFEDWFAEKPEACMFFLMLCDMDMFHILKLNCPEEEEVAPLRRVNI